MSEETKTPFLDMFPFCAELGDLCGGLKSAAVVSATVSRERLTMTIEAQFARAPAPAEKHTLEGRIAAHYGLSSVTLNSLTAYALTKSNSAKPAPASSEAGTKKASGSAAPGKVIFGRAIKGESVPMDTLNLESGNVVVQGKIF